MKKFDKDEYIQFLETKVPCYEDPNSVIKNGIRYKSAVSRTVNNEAITFCDILLSSYKKLDNIEELEDVICRLYNFKANGFDAIPLKSKYCNFDMDYVLDNFDNFVKCILNKDTYNKIIFKISI